MIRNSNLLPQRVRGDVQDHGWLQRFREEQIFELGAIFIALLRRIQTEQFLNDSAFHEKRSLLNPTLAMRRILSSWPWRWRIPALVIR